MIIRSEINVDYSRISARSHKWHLKIWRRICSNLFSPTLKRRLKGSLMHGIFSIRESSISLSSNAAGIAAYDNNKTQCCCFRSKARLPACSLLFSLLFAAIIDTPRSHAENFTAICEASALSTCDLRSSKKSTLAPIRERARLFESRGSRCRRDRRHQLLSMIRIEPV